MLQSYAVLDQPGEVYLAASASPWLPESADGTRQIVIRTPGVGDVKGVLFVPNAARTGLEPLPFRVPAAAAQADADSRFYAVKLANLHLLLSGQAPGGAWFRHQIAVTREELGRTKAEQTAPLDVPGVRRADATG